MVAHSNALALDVGEVRVGVAVAEHGLGIARPLTTLANDETLVTKIQELLNVHNIKTVVVGLPRGLDGQDTQQSKKVEQFASQLEKLLNTEIHLQDEALTSVRAKETLAHSGKPFTKEDVDAVAASLILSDYMDEVRV